MNLIKMPNLDNVTRAVRESEPSAAEIEQAAARVKGRLFPAAPASTGTIRSCADFQSLIPARLTGALDPGRNLLLEVHLRECVSCRKALQPANVVVMPARRTASVPYPWAIAAAALLVAGSAGYYGFHQYPALVGGPRATVDSIDGALYKVAGATLTPLAPGATLGENDAIRTAKNSTAVLHLNDGSRIELNQRAEISVTRDWSGSTVHLALGGIIVEAAKQRKGSLQVLTADCNVSVKGTVFAVDAGTKGSRVAVVEGTVWVDHGQKHDVLHRGDSTATAAGMDPVPVRRQVEWSRNSSQYNALLGEFGELTRQFAAIPTPGLRYQSNLIANLPADVVGFAAIPNIGGTVAQADQIFHNRLQQSPTLAAWWNQVPAARRDEIELVVRQLQTATQYLGDEIVVALLPDHMPIVIARITRAGLDTYLRSQLPAELFNGHLSFDNGLFIAASRPADAGRIGTAPGFLTAPLFSKIDPAYQHGAEWLFGADLARLPQAPQLLDARYIVAESRTAAGITENRASVTFSKERQGIASWLTAPGPMGSLDFISPDAGFAVSMLLKNPGVLVKDLPGGFDPELVNELAGAFGGEFTIALDGPLLPAPSWKIAAEINSPDRLQSVISKFAKGDVKLTQAEVEGRIFYHLQSDKLPWGAEWTYIDGYWLAAANRELLIRSIQNRQTGYTLAKSQAFQSKLPRDASPYFSAVVWENIAQPGAICLWAAPDRIDAAAMGLNLESLLSINSPSDLLRQILNGRTVKE